MPDFAALLLLAAVFGVALLPTRRLFLSGWTSRPLAAYLALLLGLGLVVAMTRGRIGFLLPILVLAYLAPFVTARQGARAVRDRLTGRMRNVTPADEYGRSRPNDPGDGSPGGA